MKFTSLLQLVRKSHQAGKIDCLLQVYGVLSCAYDCPSLCFLVSNAGSFCGNYRVDMDEDCDPGDPGDNVKGDPCCDEKCKLKEGANCRYLRVIDRKVVGQTVRQNQRKMLSLPRYPPTCQFHVVSIHLPTHLFACGSTCTSGNLPNSYLSITHTYPPTRLPNYLTNHLATYKNPPTYTITIPTHKHIFLPTLLLAYLSTHPPTNLLPTFLCIY